MNLPASQRGSMALYVAALLFIGLGVVALAVDVGLWSATYREAAFAADAGAEAGAAMLDIEAAYWGAVQLDVQEAEEAAVAGAIAARPRTGRVATAESTSDRVCVTVSQTFTPVLLQALNVAPAQATVSACAEPRRG